MAKHGDMRSRPDKLHPGTASVICVRLDYLESSPEPGEILASDTRAYVSRYALGRDYHKVIRGKLKKLVARIDDYVSAHGFDGLADARRFCAAFVAADLNCIPVRQR